MNLLTPLKNETRATETYKKGWVSNPKSNTLFPWYCQETSFRILVPDNYIGSYNFPMTAAYLQQAKG